MKIVRTVAHARQAAPAFGVLTDVEIIALRQLPGWVRWLYFELVAMSDFKTGVVRTSYDQLAALMDCDQPERGPRLSVPTIKQIRTALDTLARMGMALRDRGGNEEHRVLQIQLMPRQGFSASKPKQGREQGRARRAHKPDEHGPKPAQATETGQGLGQVSQEFNSYPYIPNVDNLSTEDARKKLREQADEMRARAPQKKGPPGGRKHAPAGHAPGAVDAQTPEVGPEGSGEQQGPPRGRKSAPAGPAPVVPSLLTIGAVLNVLGDPSGFAPAPGAKQAIGACLRPRKDSG